MKKTAAVVYPQGYIRLRPADGRLTDLIRMLRFKAVGVGLSCGLHDVALFSSTWDAGRNTHETCRRTHYTHLSAVRGRREPHGAAEAATAPLLLLLVERVRAAALPPTAVGVVDDPAVALLCCNVKAKPRTSATRRATPAAATNPRRR